MSISKTCLLNQNGKIFAILHIFTVFKTGMEIVANEILLESILVFLVAPYFNLSRREWKILIDLMMFSVILFLLSMLEIYGNWSWFSMGSSMVACFMPADRNGQHQCQNWINHIWTKGVSKETVKYCCFCLSSQVLLFSSVCTSFLSIIVEALAFSLGYSKSYSMVTWY